MKEKFLIFIFGLLINSAFSQEIHSAYKFKKTEKKKKFDYFELDSLVLYKNGSFYRKDFYQYHQINFYEYKGDWRIENGILFLEVSYRNTNNFKKDWLKSSGKIKYSIKRNKITPVPVVDDFNQLAIRKLKRISR